CITEPQPTGIGWGSLVVRLCRLIYCGCLAKT
ncbi:hypothetical protein ACUXSN_002508, partial [Staphylococcus capitis]